MNTQTKKLLEKEIKNLTQARDGIGVALTILRGDDITEDEHLIELYNKINTKIKDYSHSIDVLNEDDNESCVKG